MTFRNRIVENRIIFKIIFLLFEYFQTTYCVDKPTVCKTRATIGLRLNFRDVIGYLRTVLGAVLKTPDAPEPLDGRCRRETGKKVDFWRQTTRTKTNDNIERNARRATVLFRIIFVRVIASIRFSGNDRPSFPMSRPVHCRRFL